MGYFWGNLSMPAWFDKNRRSGRKQKSWPADLAVLHMLDVIKRNSYKGTGYEDLIFLELVLTSIFLFIYFVNLSKLLL